MFDFLKGSPQILDKATDGIINGADLLFLTDEEKLQYQQEAAKLWLKIQESIRDENSIRSITRRYIAVLSTICYFLLVFLAVVVYSFNSDWSAFIFGILTSELGWMVLGINAFYFGPHMIGRLKK